MSEAPTVARAGAALTEAQRSRLGRATIGDQLRRHAQTLQDKPAIVSYDAAGRREVTTYAELDQRANRFAHALLALGVGRGDRVAVMSRNRVEVVVAYYGILKAGAAYSGISFLLGAREVAQQVAHLQPAVVVVSEELAPVVEAVVAEHPVTSVVVVGTPHVEGWHAWDDQIGRAHV